MFLKADQASLFPNLTKLWPSAEMFLSELYFESPTGIFANIYIFANLNENLSRLCQIHLKYLIAGIGGHSYPLRTPVSDNHCAMGSRVMVRSGDPHQLI